MEILGIGMSELIFIVIIALIVLGPKDMQKAGATIGKWLRSIVTSDGWKVFQQMSREMRNLPNKLMREANEDLNKIGGDINKSINPERPRYGSWDTPGGSRPTAPASPLPATPPAAPTTAPVTEPQPRPESDSQTTTPKENQESNA